MMDQAKAIKQLNELKKHNKNPRLAAEGWNKPWKTLIATLLSARSRDDKTVVVAKELFRKFNTVKKLSEATQSDIAKVIRPVNFYITKAKNTSNCAKALIKDHKGKVPVDFDKLVKLPGVGRKTANVFLAVQGKPAIGVDTHVARISKKLGWTKNDKPEKVEEDLKKLFPKSKWKSINYILVKFGQSNTRKKEDEILKSL